jgi:hypothetical protein
VEIANVPIVASVTAIDLIDKQLGMTLRQRVMEFPFVKDTCNGPSGQIPIERAAGLTVTAGTVTRSQRAPGMGGNIPCRFEVSE